LLKEKNKERSKKKIIPKCIKKQLKKIRQLKKKPKASVFYRGLHWSFLVYVTIRFIWVIHTQIFKYDKFNILFFKILYEILSINFIGILFKK